MNDNVSEFIKKIRKDNGLTQKELASSLGVTFQAVSKWENGINIPDIMILKEISNKYNVNIDEIINGSKKNNKLWIPLTILGIIILILIFSIFSKEEDIEFKTISTTCDNFTIYGSMAFNKSNSHLNLSNIEYCGGEDNELYKSIECTIYENNNNKIKELDKINYSGEGIKLETFLEDIDFNLDNFSNNCKLYDNNSLYLEINATNINDKTINYKIPLDLNDTCEK